MTRLVLVALDGVEHDSCGASMLLDIGRPSATTHASHTSTKRTSLACVSAAACVLVVGMRSMSSQIDGNYVFHFWCHDDARGRRRVLLCLDWRLQNAARFNNTTQFVVTTVGGSSYKRRPTTIKVRLKFKLHFICVVSRIINDELLVI